MPAIRRRWSCLPPRPAPQLGCGGLVVLEQAYGTIVSGEGFGAAVATAEVKTDVLAAIVDRQHRRGTRGAHGHLRKKSGMSGMSRGLRPTALTRRWKSCEPLFEHAAPSGNTVITSFGAMLNRLRALISTIWLSSRTTISLRLSSPALM